MTSSGSSGGSVEPFKERNAAPASAITSRLLNPGPAASAASSVIPVFRRPTFPETPCPIGHSGKGQSGTHSRNRPGRARRSRFSARSLGRPSQTGMRATTDAPSSGHERQGYILSQQPCRRSKMTKADRLCIKVALVPIVAFVSKRGVEAADYAACAVD